MFSPLRECPLQSPILWKVDNLAQQVELAIRYLKPLETFNTPVDSGGEAELRGLVKEINSHFRTVEFRELLLNCVTQEQVGMTKDSNLQLIKDKFLEADQVKEGLIRTIERSVDEFNDLKACQKEWLAIKGPAEAMLGKLGTNHHGVRFMSEANRQGKQAQKWLNPLRLRLSGFKRHGP
ncbi:MAG: hypothetical protein K2X93_13015 [Candidatus Obscuribacterales bacterium]|nr:hypothetical protein [Candidatus Obscuribacterales bacterium]